MSIIFELCNADNDPLNALQHLDYDSPEAYATAVELEEHYTLLHAEKIKASIDGTTFKPEEIDFKQLKSEPYASNKGLSHFDFYQMSWIVAYHTSHWFWICRRLPYEDLFQPFAGVEGRTV